MTTTIQYPKSIKKALLAFVLLLTACAACAQTVHAKYESDSIAFSNVLWNTDSLDGFVYRHYHFDRQPLFNSKQYICVIEIPSGSETHLEFAADTVRTLVSDFVGRRKALAGINGSFFNMQTGKPVCYLKVNGQKMGDNDPQQNDTSLRKYYQNATICLRSGGKPHFYIPDSNRMAEDRIPDSNIMTTGPMLLFRGKAVPQRTDLRFVYGRHARSAIGRKADGTVVLLVADGRHLKQSEGLSLHELTLIMRWLGCHEAANLDGGGSTCMHVDGKGVNGTVNHPMDNGSFDADGQRRVANAILLVK